MKNKITTLANKCVFVFVLMAFFSTAKTFGQIGIPTYPFSQICASPSFNTFTLNFTFSTANTYVLEMSDANGSFATLTGITILSSQTSTSPGSFTFKVPTTTAGENYRFRVRGGTTTGPQSSPALAAYYKAFNADFTLNGGISPINICGSGIFQLLIDNGPASNDSPVDFPSLKYKWKKNGVFVPGETGSFLNINSSGDYQAFVDYGNCSTLDDGQIEKSVKVTVNIVAAGSTFTIASSSGNTICPPATSILSVTAGYSYQWSRDGVAISGAQANTYVASQAGSYTVIVNQGGCSSTSTPFVLSTEGFNSSIDVQQEPLANIISAGETKTITVTTDAVSPTFEWYLNGTLIPLATTNSYTTSDVGNYKVKIKQTSGCNTFKEFFFLLKEGINPKQVPNLISPNADGVNDTWVIPQDYVNANTEVLIIDPQGNVDFQTVNYQNNWPVKEIVFKSTNPVYYYIISKDGSPVKKGSITIIK
ncbi:gliding motility-associated C-terminal domain-containing protein [Flavobacterium psychrophilum]|uniref:T9SS type B sorting domain-containing protein n=1 Tax=Flavobacterium psychrophilum TaxID=96345 RepID=UPI000B7C1F41|nr:gliding motility-associated C-terminal domain-containing protein [Flavobacterium psychrophilum]EKT4551620.1 gliding motility-associated C-terminal domain-containing protein [Flavobacterium psychrophilum]ELY1980151.1 gliding motility-associated C-terminal domain-containing protein [Flavobacterium psychrophilum]ELY1992350.1 gliding motility-associated C-terminal domain-containing protein [Flavobacterium psychrophilum]MCB6099208.1 gliding motility-associated C-terminal domain-containing protein